MTVTGSIGLLAPARTPIAIIEATHTAVADPAYKQMLSDAGIEPIFASNPEKFRQSLASDVAIRSALADLVRERFASRRHWHVPIPAALIRAMSK